MSIDAIAGSQAQLDGVARLLSDNPDLAARFATRKLSHPKDRAKAAYLLKQILPEITMPYLVPALADSSACEAASEVIKSYGPSQQTVKPLADAASDPLRRDAILGIFRHYGATEGTLRHLGAALSETSSRNGAVAVFEMFGASQATVNALAAAYSTYSREAVHRVARVYGRASLPFLDSLIQSGQNKANALAIRQYVLTQTR